MAKYIDADALISDVKEMRDTPNGYSDTFDKSEIIGVIEEQPAADVRENVRGEWIKRDSYDRRDNFYACSECGRIINIICNAHLEDYPFCHCGADMRKKGEE